MTVQNRADPDDVRPVPLGACRCPGTPLETDSAVVVARFGYGAKAAIKWAGWRRSGGAFHILEDAQIEMVALGVRSWTLTDKEGKPRPVTREEVELLDEATIEAICEALYPAIKEERIPKASAGPSPGGTRGRAGRTPRRPTPPPSTTS